MRIPQTPPDTSSVYQDFQRLVEILKATPPDSSSHKYLHWDKLRHLATPSGLTHLEWWAGIKFRRSNQWRIVPLRDVRGQPFRLVMVDPIPEQLHLIDLAAGGRIEMPDQITNPDTRDRYIVSSLIQEAITSSQLEGAATTRQIAAEMLREGRAPRDRSERMVLNNFLTMQRIAKLKGESLSKELVFDLHRLVTEGTLDDASAAGRFRHSSERVDVGDDFGKVFHQPPPADELESRLDAMCAFANGQTPEGFVHPAVRSMILHFWLAYDHPFVDGNGRTARALFYWAMLKNGFWLCEFISISEIILKHPAKYGRAFLYTETDDNDLTYFLLYHLDVIRRAVDQLHRYVERKTQQIRMLERQIRAVSTLNHRQRAIIAHALRHPNNVYTIESHQRSHGVAYETARTDLLNLAARGLLTNWKTGREWRFAPVESLEQVLEELH